jgi:CHAT domain-containing protein/tetratricopeptide (TPR) repeat protein
MGNAYQRQGEMGLALETYERARRMAEELNDYQLILRSYNNIAIVYAVQGDYERALEYFQKSLALNREQRDKVKTGATSMDDDALGVLMNIGNVHRHRGSYRRALEYYQQAVTLNEKLGNKMVAARLLNNIGNVYKMQNDDELAFEYYQKSLVLKEAVDDKQGIAVALSNMGDTARQLGDYAHALDYLQRSLDIYEALKAQASVAEVLTYISRLYQSQGDAKRALDSSQRSLALSESLGEKVIAANDLEDLANIYHGKGDDAQASDYAERALALARSTGEREVLWEALMRAGRIQLGLGRTAEARKDFEESIATIEALRSDVAGGEQEQQSSFADKVAPYHDMVALLVAQHDFTGALGYAERAKARVLLDVLQWGRSNVTKAMTAPERAQERELTSKLVMLNTQLARERARPKPDAGRLPSLESGLQQARREHEVFENALYAAHPELKVRRGGVAPLKLEEAAALLPDAGGALLEYAVTEDATYLFVLTKRAQGARPTLELSAYTIEIKQQELARLAERFRSQLAGRDLSFSQSALQLYDLLVKPAQPLLKGKSSLVIVPDQELWNLPFQALQPAPGRYLLEDAAVSYSPSLSVLRELVRARERNTAAVPSALLAVGNPVVSSEVAQRIKAAYRDEPLEPLPETEAEVRTLGRLYGAGRSAVFVGADARESRVKAEAGRYGVLHIATHGVFDDASPMYSYLVLSQAAGDGEDGLLEAREIMELDLKARLVVLSACETARGRVGAGEGVIGMMWAVFIAGCPTTVVSQWKVDAASTTDLMLEFHRRLRWAPGGTRAAPTKAEALRQAALRLMKDERYHHPFYWAGFVVVGDSG